MICFHHIQFEIFFFLVSFNSIDLKILFYNVVQFFSRCTCRFIKYMFSVGDYCFSLEATFQKNLLNNFSFTRWQIILRKVSHFARCRLLKCVTACWYNLLRLDSNSEQFSVSPSIFLKYGTMSSKLLFTY